MSDQGSNPSQPSPVLVTPTEDSPDRLRAPLFWMTLAWCANRSGGLACVAPSPYSPSIGNKSDIRAASTMGRILERQEPTGSRRARNVVDVAATVVLIAASRTNGTQLAALSLSTSTLARCTLRLMGRAFGLAGLCTVFPRGVPWRAGFTMRSAGLASSTWNMTSRNQTSVDTRHRVRSPSRIDCRNRGLASYVSIRSTVFGWNTFRG